MSIDPIAIVRDFIEAWNRRDRAAIAARLHPDAVVQGIPGPPAHGRDAALDLCAPFLAADEIDWRIAHIAASGGTVLTERVDRFVFAGRPVEVQAMGIFVLDDAGSIVAWRDYFDPTVFADVLA